MNNYADDAIKEAGIVCALLTIAQTIYDTAEAKNTALLETAGIREKDEKKLSPEIMGAIEDLTVSWDGDDIRRIKKDVGRLLLKLDNEYSIL